MIDVDMDSVTVCGQKIRRPSWVSRSQWMRYWERVRDMEVR